MRCNTWGGLGRCQNEAKYWLHYAPGKPCPGGYSCTEHAMAVIQEYREKLGEEWYGVEIDDLGNPIPLTPLYRAE